MSTPEKMIWLGQDVETLSREELIEVIRCLADDLRLHRNMLQSTFRMNEAARARRSTA